MALEFIGKVIQSHFVCVVDSEIAVFQQLATGEQRYVALVKEFCDYGDHRTTRISYSEGELLFTAVYDGPLKEYNMDDFIDAGNGRPVALVSYLMRGSGTHHALAHDNCFYQIVVEKMSDFLKVTVYDSVPVQKDGMLCYSPLAMITLPERDEGTWEYSCHIERNLPTPLCMAIVALPFIIL